jgi:membrane fusion protein (multidrug efflux system)
VKRRGSRLSRIGLASMIAALVAGCSADAIPAAKDSGPEPLAVEATPVKRGPLAPRIASNARLEARREATVRTETGGDVLAVLVEEGDRVAAGQVLARLDGTHALIQHRERVAIAERGQARAGRTAALAARGLASTDALETDIAIATDARLAADLSATAVGDRELRAPFPGVVARRHVKAGHRLGPGEAAFTIIDPSDLRAEIAVPERDLLRLAPGQPARVVAEAAPGCAIEARVSDLSPSIDRRTGTGAARIEFSDPHGQCRPGLSVRVSVEFANLAEAVLVPRAALVDGADGAAVFVVEDGLAVRRPVELGLEEGEWIQVTRGLEGGERVVTLGQQRLVPGDPVLEITTPGMVRRIPAHRETATVDAS